MKIILLLLLKVDEDYHEIKLEISIHLKKLIPIFFTYSE